jgi:hypothetical protein
MNEQIAEVIDSLGLTMEAKFVPYSRSRHAKPSPKLDDLHLNWEVTIKHKGQEVLTTDYSAGIAHSPAYKDPKSRIQSGSGGFSQWGFDRVRWECENGLETRSDEGDGGIFYGMRWKRIMPDIAHVLACLLMDAEAIDYPTFEEWANNMGYNADSRKAEAIYRECVEHGLKLRAGVGEDGLKRLKGAFQDY